MQFALLIYESAQGFAARKNDRNDPYIGAWRAYYKALVESGVYVGGDPLEVPDLATTVQLKDAKRLVQDGPYAEMAIGLSEDQSVRNFLLKNAADSTGFCRNHPSRPVTSIEAEKRRNQNVNAYNR
jgi:hypothetical protein